MFEGIACYNVLREHPQTVTVKVMGMAASAASIIAMAGDQIEIGAASFLMIHNRSEEHTSELQSLMRISYAVFCLKKKNNTYIIYIPNTSLFIRSSYLNHHVCYYSSSLIFFIL